MTRILIELFDVFALLASALFLLFVLGYLSALYG